jgi:CubicO group peptidase (beta-lactamase class C family)
MANSTGTTPIKPNRLVILLSLVALLSGRPALAHVDLTAPDIDARSTSLSQLEGPTDPVELEAFFDDFMVTQLEEHHVAGAAVAIVKDGALFFVKGYGYADVENGVSIDPETTLFPLASVTKLLTWTAVMQLSERGMVNLDKDVNTYLDFEIPDTYPGRPVTLKHLVAHTAGFEQQMYGMFPSCLEDVLPLGEWLAGNIPGRVFPPGEVTAYSNYGAALAGYIVERVSGMPYHEYIERYILEPLGMEHATVRQPVPDHLASDMARQYRFVGGAFEAADREWSNVPPAGSGSASATDMAKFMIAHLQGGRYGDARILEEATAQLMHSHLFANDERLNGFAYGFVESDRNGQRIIGHGGGTGLVSSLLVLFPEHDLGLFVAYNSVGATQSLLEEFVDLYYPAPGPAAVEPPGGFSQRADRFVGSYRDNTWSYTTVEKLAVLLMPVTVRASGDMLLFAAPQEVPFVEVEPLVFRQVGDDELLVFREDSEGHITHMFLSSIVRFAFEKLKWYEAPGFHRTLRISSLVLFASFLIAAPLSFFVKRRREDAAKTTPRLASVARWALIVIAILAILFDLSFEQVFSLEDIAAGDVALLKTLLVIPILMTVLTVGPVVFTGLAWRNGYWHLSERIHYMLVTLAAIAYIWFLNYWNLLGWQF